MEPKDADFDLDLERTEEFSTETAELPILQVGDRVKVLRPGVPKGSTNDDDYYHGWVVVEFPEDPRTNEPVKNIEGTQRAVVVLDVLGMRQLKVFEDDLVKVPSPAENPLDIEAMSERHDLSLLKSRAEGMKVKLKGDPDNIWTIENIDITVDPPVVSLSRKENGASIAFENLTLKQFAGRLDDFTLPGENFPQKPQ